MSTSNDINIKDVPILDGTNYAIWAERMTTVLRTKGVWQIVTKTQSRPPAIAHANPPTAVNTEAIFQRNVLREAFNNKDDIAVGLIASRCALSLKHHWADRANANDPNQLVAQTSHGLWDSLAAEFASPGLTNLFSKFKAAVAFVLNRSEHPHLAMSALSEIFSCLEVNQLPINEKLQAMILLNAAQRHYDNTASTLLTTVTFANLTMKIVSDALITEYERKHATAAGQILNKKTTVSRKGDEPKHKKTSKGNANATASSSKSNPKGKDQSNRKRGSGKGEKGKGKETPAPKPQPQGQKRRERKRKGNAAPQATAERQERQGKRQAPFL